MTSLVIDPEQRKLLHSFTPPASQPGTTSLQDKEAHSAPGKSRDTAICIPSDAVKTMRVKHSMVRNLIHIPAYGTFWPNIDFTATEPDATIGANTASAISSTQADATPAWPIESNDSHLADTELSQQSYGMNHLLVENTPTECQDIHFDTPPTSPESQSYPFTVDGKQLRPEPAIQQEKMIVHDISAYDICNSSYGHQDCPSIGAQPPQTVNPVEVVQASLQENEIPANKSYDDAIPEICIPSPELPSNEPCPGQALDDTNSASIPVEPEVTEVGSGSDALVSSTSTSLRRFRHKYS
ncbi:hypothetical protein FOCG_17564 [Fusarium oxysporum f. sp. radicis-lycopersici 26381]|nr:hypothetical protein FOCG_17564 [Fusarium oxysporum f. sp. radicis-lycopersici 26381]